LLSAVSWNESLLLPQTFLIHSIASMMGSYQPVKCSFGDSKREGRVKEGRKEWMKR